MIDNRQVGRKIAALRQGNALTQQQLAAMMNVSHQAVSKWESGQALPDIQTMLQLTRFFGITMEQLISNEELKNEEETQADAYADAEMNDTKAEEMPETEKEATNMSIQQLLQMAPYMSRETVEEIVNEIEEPLTAAQIARIAPYVRPECVEKLIERHKPELSWDVLRRIAPFMRREAVDALARAIARGRETVKPAGENINKAFSDIGKAFDDIGREMGRAVKKAVRFGENVINEVSSAFNDLTSEPVSEPETQKRSERVMSLRRRAFERALQEGKWDWLAQHIGEMQNDRELLDQIAARAREENMQDWICENMGSYADAGSVDKAIEDEKWDWIGEHAWEMDEAMQERIAKAAAEKGMWKWLTEHAGRMHIEGCAAEIAASARKAGENDTAAYLAIHHMTPEQVGALAREACGVEEYHLLETILPFADENSAAEVMCMLAREQEWSRVEKFIEDASGECIENLMEIALEQGNFDAVDMLDNYL